MVRVFVLVLVLVIPQIRSYDPAKLVSGPVEGIPYRTHAAGLVLVELAVDAQGRVTDSRIIQDVEPFTDVVRQSVTSWRFDPARVNRQRAESRVLVAGLFRPAMLQFQMPEVRKSPDAKPSEEIPFPTSFEVPPYPPNAIGSKYVVVEVDVGESGTVNSVTVHGESSGFDSAALQAARDWKFRPASLEGSPVAARAYIIFAFRQPS
jgi:TonB family protein